MIHGSIPLRGGEIIRIGHAISKLADAHGVPNKFHPREVADLDRHLTPLLVGRVATMRSDDLRRELRAHGYACVYRGRAFTVTSLTAAHPHHEDR